MLKKYNLGYENETYILTVERKSSMYTLKIGEGSTCVFINIYRKLPSNDNMMGGTKDNIISVHNLGTYDNKVF